MGGGFRMVSQSSDQGVCDITMEILKLFGVLTTPKGGAAGSGGDWSHSTAWSFALCGCGLGVVLQSSDTDGPCGQFQHRLVTFGGAGVLLWLVTLWLMHLRGRTLPVRCAL